MSKTNKLKIYSAPWAELVGIEGSSIICTSVDKEFENLTMEEYEFEGGEYVW